MLQDNNAVTTQTFQLSSGGRRRRQRGESQHLVARVGAEEIPGVAEMPPEEGPEETEGSEAEGLKKRQMVKWRLCPRRQTAGEVKGQSRG